MGFITLSLLAVAAVIGLYAVTSNDSPPPPPPEPEWQTSEDARRLAREAAEHQRRYDEAIRQHRAAQAREEIRQRELDALAARQLAARQRQAELMKRAREDQDAREAMENAKTPVDASQRTFDKWRELASKSAKSRSEAFKQAAALRAMGDKVGARQWSNQGKQYADAVKSYNKLGALEAFKTHNPDYDPKTVLGLQRCDLHGLYVEEAIQYVKDHLQACKDVGIVKTSLITGKGNGSKDGVPKIKLAVIDLLETTHVVHSVDSRNEGCVIVRI